jgi:hypothetical protein
MGGADPRELASAVSVGFRKPRPGGCWPAASLRSRKMAAGELLLAGAKMLLAKYRQGTNKVNTQRSQLRPYTLDNTKTRLIFEVKLVMAQSVLRSETTREYCVL